MLGCEAGLHPADPQAGSLQVRSGKELPTSPSMASMDRDHALYSGTSALPHFNTHPFLLPNSSSSLTYSVKIFLAIS